MKTPDIPENEAARLKTLRSLNILDTPQEERFDRLTRMAKRIFGTPIALISLVDENRQWFKSCMGIDVPETSRSISFCGHAILGDDIFIIPDATKDARFADNPLVINDPKIRFYAGCPLRALDGSKLGTLCVIDRIPKNLSYEDVQTFKDLASMAEREIAAMQLATLDSLTQISNKVGFMMLARHSLNLYHRQGIPASLVLIDLNDIKSINNKFGHSAGDKVLIRFADLVKSTFRDSDIFARVGDNEFVVLFTNASKQLAEKIIEKLHLSIDKHNAEVEPNYQISFSSAIVEFNIDKHPTIEELLTEATLCCARTRTPTPPH